MPSILENLAGYFSDADLRKINLFYEDSNKLILRKHEGDSPSAYLDWVYHLEETVTITFIFLLQVYEWVV